MNRRERRVADWEDPRYRRRRHLSRRARLERAIVRAEETAARYRAMHARGWGDFILDLAARSEAAADRARTRLSRLRSRPGWQWR
ncbi:MAG: hypothetical protein WBQ18_17115 [Solirubrobacteraceae bacterium]